MPLYYNSPTAHPIWITSSSAATGTAPGWIWLSTPTATATSTVTVVPTSATIYAQTWAVNDDYLWRQPTWWPATAVETRLRRIAIARRSYQQAIEHDLHDMYRREEHRQRAELAQHNEAAMARSRELLLEHLTPAQRESFERNKWFVIEGGKSRQRYRIRAAVHMVANVDVIAVRDDGSEVVSHRLCAHCRLDEVPLFDQLLAQKLMLEFDEERFLSLANHHRAAA